MITAIQEYLLLIYRIVSQVSTHGHLSITYTHDFGLGYKYHALILYGGCYIDTQCMHWCLPESGRLPGILQYNGNADECLFYIMQMKNIQN